MNITQSDGMLRPMARLAAPVLAEETLTLMVTWTDWWLTGHFLVEAGDDAKAAMGLMGYTMWLIPSMFAAVAIGATALIARRVGEGNRSRAQWVANQAILLGIFFALFVTSLTWLLGGQYVSAMQLEGQAAKYAQTYLLIMIPVIPMIMFEQVGAACLRGAGDMVTGLIAKSIVVVVNIAVSTSLLVGVGGMESWGWNGIAVGTAVGHTVGGTIIFLALLRGRAGLKLNLRMMRFKKSIAVLLLKIGTPGGLDMLLILTCQLIFVGMVNSLGSAAAAAHGLAVQIEACAYLPAHAFLVAAATMTGQYLGAGQTHRATIGALACTLCSIILISIAGALMLIFGPSFAAIFTGDVTHPTTLQAGKLIRIVAFALPSLATVMVISGALRGAGDTVWPFIISLLGFVLIRIPLAAFLAYDTVVIPFVNLEVSGFGWGVSGAWLAMAIDLVIRSLMIAGRFVHGGWKHVRL